VSLYYPIDAFLTHLKALSSLTPQAVYNFVVAVSNIRFVTNKSSEDLLMLPEDFIDELRYAGLFK